MGFWGINLPEILMTKGYGEEKIKKCGLQCLTQITQWMPIQVVPPKPKIKHNYDQKSGRPKL